MKKLFILLIYNYSSKFNKKLFEKNYIELEDLFRILTEGDYLERIKIMIYYYNILKKENIFQLILVL